jgi:hypothetical protein
MKTIASFLIALSLFAGIAAAVAPASAAKSLAEQLESEGRFGHAI